MTKLLNQLAAIRDPRREAVLTYHRARHGLLTTARGSRSKHQAWPGGYADHVAETLAIARTCYEALAGIRPLPFSLGSAEIVLVFHDIEKLYRGTGDPFDKRRHLESLADVGIPFTDQEWNALRYVHGEPDAEYNPDRRVMNELAAFVHSCDILSARMWHDHPRSDRTRQRT